MQAQQHTRASLWSLGLKSALVVAAMAASASCRSFDRGASLDLSTDGVHGSAVVVSTEGQTLVYNLRAIEPGVLYRASDFNRMSPAQPASPEAQPLAFQDGQLFAALRALNIHHVVSLLPPPEYYVEEGYFQFWTKRSGYTITTTSLLVPPDDTYLRNDRSGVHAAAELLLIMKHRKPEDGAVLIHGEQGRDAIGVMAAAYELARTSGRVDESAAWNSIVRRYLASNALVSPSPGSMPLTSAPLERVRLDLIFLAKLF